MNFAFWNKRSLSVIRQNDQAECALACIAMIAEHLDLDVPIDYLRLRFPASVFGTKLSTIVHICSEIGLTARAVRLELNEMPRLQTPCILHWKMGHYVVLVKVKKNGLLIHDPAAGQVLVPIAEADVNFTGVALELSRCEGFSGHKGGQVSASINWLKFATSVKGFHGVLARSFGLAVILEILSLAQPVFTQLMIDQATNPSSTQLIVWLALGLAMLSLSSLVLASVRTWIIGVIQGRLFLSSSSNVFAHILLLPSAFFERRRLGDVVSRFNTIGSIQRILSTRLVEVILDGMVSALTFGALFVYSNLFAAITLAALVAQMAVKLLSYSGLAEATAKTISINARQQNRLVEAIRLIQTIRTSNSQPKVLERYLDLGVTALNADMTVQRFDILTNFCSTAISTAEKIALMAIGAVLVSRHSLTVGALVAGSYLSLQFSARSRNFMDYVLQLRLLRLQQGRLADIVNAPPETNFSTRYIGSADGFDIVLRAINFRYNQNDQWILKNVDLEIQAGEFVAVVGPSGCGKSTLVKLLAGIISPTSGDFTFGNIDIESLGKSRYRDMLGVALQDSGLFSGTVAENISMFDETATLERITDAAKMACVHDDILAKPMGYNTSLGGIESHLSAGQRQRIILARVFYRTPKIIILDEATCHVDMRAEHEILRNLGRLDATRVMVTHRHSAALYADKIYEIDSGKVHLRKKTVPDSLVEVDE